MLGCNKSPTTPNIEPTPWPSTKFNEPKITFEKNNVTIGFGSILLPPDQIIEGIFQVDLNDEKHITRIWSFIGVDEGNIGEFAIDFSGAKGRIYQRSLHKETNGIYDAWDYIDTDLNERMIVIHTLGHMVQKPGHLELELILETK